MGAERADCHRAEGSLKNRHRFPGTPAERPKAPSRCRPLEKVCPQARYNSSEGRPSVTLSFGDAMQLERLTMVTLMAFKLPLKMWKLRRVNNLQQSICGACHPASRNYQSVCVCVAEVLKLSWWEGSPHEAWTADERMWSRRDNRYCSKNWLPVQNWNIDRLLITNNPIWW